jgi:hypothetical protein
MKQAFHKIMSMLMAFVVMFSTMSFTLNMHYCGDTLVETAVFHKAKGCGMEMGNPSFEGCTMIKKNCCSDEQQAISGQDELQLSFDKISFDQQVFVAAFSHTYNNLFELSEDVTPSLITYPPPIIVRQLYKLDETYLI